MKKYINLFSVVFLCAAFSCTKDVNNIDPGLNDVDGYAIAIPLVNAKITVNKVAELSKGNTSISIAADGKATVFYNGEVIRRSSATIFPPFPGLLPLDILDTLSSIQLPIGSEYKIKKAIFKGTKIFFTFQNNLAEDVKINMKILELSKAGQAFEQDFVLKYENSLPSKLVTVPISVDGWTLLSDQNSMTFDYDAVLADGRKIKLDKAQMHYDVIIFSVIEGYLGYHEYAVDGNLIDVGLFNKWLSGSFDFTDPKIKLSVDNAFGLPVRSKVNKMELTSITGKVVGLQSEFIDKGIDFAYPSFDEMGQTKNTNFDFDNTNSNIREVFNEKTKSIAYDIEALINPDRDTTIRGYINDNSFFVVNLAIEVPLVGSLNQVVLTDTVDINDLYYEEVTQAKIKSIIINDFPAEVTVQAYFLDTQGNVIDQLFSGEGIYMTAAPLQANGKTTAGIEKIDEIDFDPIRYQAISKSKKLAIISKINTTGSDTKTPLWIYDSYGIGLKLGAIINYKKK